MGPKEALKASEFTYTAIFEPAEEGGYVVTVPTLPGVVTEGDTLDEARRMVADAIQCYLESMQKDGLPLPESDIDEQVPLAEKVTIQLKTV